MTKILYVDDDVPNLTVFEASCGADFDILTASSGKEALALMRKHEVGVLLTDQRMPEMSGVELAEAVRAEFPDVIRMLVTAYADMNAVIEAINRGHVRRYLRKPWDPTELTATLREAVDLYNMSRKVNQLERRLTETERVYALGVVAAGIAHEIRNPITSITGNLDLVRDQLRRLLVDLEKEPLPVESMNEMLKEMTEEVADAISGTARVLDIAKGIELSTRVREKAEPIDVGEIVTLTLKSVQGELRKRAQLKIDTQPVPVLSGSRTKLGQVVLNLIVNALEALPERPRRDNLITIRLAPEGTAVRLEVEDNGPGIPADVKAHIFDPFFTTKRNGGTGLGLAISKKIVEEFGGTIDLWSEPGVGTRFSIRIPSIVEARPPAATAVVPGVPAMRAR